MMTHTHILIGAALFARPDSARPGARAATAAAIAGAVAPDLDVAAMWIIERMNGVSSCVIFSERFWESPWTDVQAVSNSLLLWALIAIAGAAFGRRGIALLAFGASGLLHVSGDFLLHADDARAHLQPFTDWRFHSPVSYWDPAHYGRVAGVVEAVCGAALVALLWRRFAGFGARAALATAAGLYGLGVAATAMSSDADFDHHDDCVRHAALIEIGAPPVSVQPA